MDCKGQTNNDTCSAEDLSKLFQTTYTSVTSVTVAEKEAYCLHLTSDSNWNSLAVAMSDMSVAGLKGDTLERTYDFKPHEERITGLKLSPENSNLVWTSSSDGFVKLWDVRSNKVEKEFSGKTEESQVKKPVTTFDISNNGRILGAGTELVQDGSYLLFWDIRGGKFLGAYWESHTDDITQVTFHPSQPDTVVSSSTDGLLNVFDISQSTEDNALTYVLNANVAMDKLAWMREGSHLERLAGITDIHTLQYWNVKEATPLHEFTREKVTAAMRRKNEDECYLVNVSMTNDGDDPIVLVGSGLEDSTCLRTLKLDLQTGRLQPHGLLAYKQKQLMTRAALYQPATDSYVTAGECGIVRLWKQEKTDSIGKDSVKKTKKNKRTKPY